MLATDKKKPTEIARQQRLRAMRQRALVIAEQHGLHEVRILLRSAPLRYIWGTLAMLVRGGRLPGWHFENLLEAADLGLESQFRMEAAGKPTEALPGTREKIEILIERVASGHELFHCRDRQPEE